MAGTPGELCRNTDATTSAADGNGFLLFENVAVTGNRIVHDYIYDGSVLGGTSDDDNLYDVYSAKDVYGLVSTGNYVESTVNRVVGGALWAWATYGVIDWSLFANNSIK